MYYQFTGQPGHGKTVLAIERALEMKAKADALHAEDPDKHPYRELYVCNVRDFNHGQAGAIELTPAMLRKWSWHPDDPQPRPIDLRKEITAEDEALEIADDRINPAFENAIILVDEAYEHRMFPRRPPGSPIPHHVWKIAKHRHYGIDFIMICQSPSKQMDDFLHDLIEEHYHVRRRYGLPFVHVKRWDRFERNPDKAEPLTRTRRRYPVHIFKLYTSTKYDTSEKRVPWYYYAVGALCVILVGALYWNYNNLKHRFGSDVVQAPQRAETEQQADGARATAAPRGVGATPARSSTVEEYAAMFIPRIPSQPWSAPAFDNLAFKSDPPRLFCMQAQPGNTADGYRENGSCTCLTEQGTRYLLDHSTCAYVATFGQYEPHLQQRQSQPQQTAPAETFDPRTQSVGLPTGMPVTGSAGTVPAPGVDPIFGTLTRPGS